MRLDKFLKVSRVIKRRSVANEACDLGRVKINDKVAKAFSGYSAENIEIVTGRGINVDQSENKISIDSERVLIDGFWVRLNTQNQKIEEPYITVLIYEK